MNKILLRIKAKYNEMGRGEKNIADWILAHPQDIISLSITGLAEKCKSGEATIVRFSRRLGLGGYQDLKISIAQELVTGDKMLGEEMLPEDSCYDLFDKTCNHIFLSLEYTRKVLKPEALEAAAEKISQAHRIAIYGLGNSAAVALDAQHKFLRAGLSATAYCDNHMQAIAACHLQEGDVALGVSHSGSSVDVVDALRLSRAAGAFTIGITNAGKSPIQKQCDIVLFTASDETRYTILGMSSRIAQLAIISSIHAYLLLRHGEKSVEAVRNTERALLGKKY
jgi:DNA-binding MurR/RpiR family transcriptional regulator